MRRAHSHIIFVVLARARDQGQRDDEACTDAGAAQEQAGGGESGHGDLPGVVIDCFLARVCPEVCPWRLAKTRLRGRRGRHQGHTQSVISGRSVPQVCA